MPISPLENEGWFHTTPSRHHASIEERGILPGRSAGVPSHRGYEDSTDSIYVCRGIETARWWARRLGDRLEGYLIYGSRSPQVLRRTGCRP